MTNENITTNQLITWLRRKTTPSGVRRVIQLSTAIASDIGSVRDENQDRSIVTRLKDKDGGTVIVIALADGIGGLQNGALCASIAIGVFTSTIRNQAQLNTGTPEEWLRRAICVADKAVFESFRGNGGSTLTGLVVRPGRSIHWVSVGDSRIYGFNGRQLTQISTDDTIAGHLISPNFEDSPEQSKLLQFIGMGSNLEIQTRVHIDQITDPNIKKIILTSDGVHYLTKSGNWLAQIVANAPDIGVCAKRLLDLAKWCGGPDNATVAILDLFVLAQKNFAFDDDYSQNSLDIWDSFGELSIVTNNIELPILKPERSVEPKINPETQSVPVETAHTSDAAKNVSQRIKKANKEKPSVKKVKANIKSPTSEKPQLNMEFPKTK